MCAFVTLNKKITYLLTTQRRTVAIMSIRSQPPDRQTDRHLYESLEMRRRTVGVLVTETLVRFFALSLDMATSAWSALSSDSSSSFCALRYLARFTAASSSCSTIHHAAAETDEDLWRMESAVWRRIFSVI